MPTLLCLKENQTAVSKHLKISASTAEGFLTRPEWKWRFSENEPKLIGPPRPLEPGYLDCDGFAVHLESKLGKFAAGYYLLVGTPAGTVCPKEFGKLFSQQGTGGQS